MQWRTSGAPPQRRYSARDVREHVEGNGIVTIRVNDREIERAVRLGKARAALDFALVKSARAGFVSNTAEDRDLVARLGEMTRMLAARLVQAGRASDVKAVENAFALDIHNLDKASFYQIASAMMEDLRELADGNAETAKRWRSAPQPGRKR